MLYGVLHICGKILRFGKRLRLLNYNNLIICKYRIAPAERDYAVCSNLTICGIDNRLVKIPLVWGKHLLRESLYNALRKVGLLTTKQIDRQKLPLFNALHNGTEILRCLCKWVYVCHNSTIYRIR